MEQTNLPLADIREWAALGLRPSVIADFVNTTVDELMRVCGPQIVAAALACHKRVLQSLYEMAISRKHPAATIFWIKNMCSDLLRTPDKEKKDASSEKKRRNCDPLDPKDYKPINFTVYCNDGEPNFDD